MSQTIISNSHINPLFASASSAVGDVASRLEDLLAQVREHFATSFSLGLSQRGGLMQLYEVLEKCGRSDWDGYGAQPVRFETYERAKRLILSLPFEIPVPEVSAEPDGDVTVEWYRGPSRVFSLSVSPNNELNYAGLFGASRTSGTEVFHDDIPEVILSHIKRVVL